MSMAQKNGPLDPHSIMADQGFEVEVKLRVALDPAGATLVSICMTETSTTRT